MAIIVKSFARIHETNLKKQGILPLTFADPADYDRIAPEATLALVGLQSITPGKQIIARVSSKNDTFEVKLNQYAFPPPFL